MICVVAASRVFVVVANVAEIRGRGKKRAGKRDMKFRLSVFFTFFGIVLFFRSWDSKRR